MRVFLELFISFNHNLQYYYTPTPETSEHVESVPELHSEELHNLAWPELHAACYFCMTALLPAATLVGSTACTFGSVIPCAVLSLLPKKPCLVCQTSLPTLAPLLLLAVIGQICNGEKK